MDARGFRDCDRLIVWVVWGSSDRMIVWRFDISVYQNSGLLREYYVRYTKRPFSDLFRQPTEVP